MKNIKGVSLKKKFQTNKNHQKNLKVLPNPQNIPKSIDASKGHRSKQSLSQNKNILNYDNVTLPMIRSYIKGVLEAIKLAHQKQTMHRDVKTQNINYNKQTQKIQLSGWKYSVSCDTGSVYTQQLNTASCRTPEVLLQNSFYDQRIDIWSIGQIFASLIFKKQSFFGKKENLFQQILRFVGIQQMTAYIQKYRINKINKKRLQSYRVEDWKKLNLQEYANSLSDDKVFYSKSAFALINKMLTLDCNQRITAVEALKDQFFNQL